MSALWNFEQLDAPYGKVSEGPIWNGHYLLYTRIQQSRIMKYDPQSGKTTEFRNPSGRANGLDFDPLGRLVAAEGANTGGWFTMTTVTVKIVSQLTGDTDFASPETLVAFALGLTLFVVTLILNVLALMIVRRYREQYD